MNPMRDLIIIGAGLAGSALASFASRLGLRVLVLDVTTPGAGGATAHSRGIVRVYDQHPVLMEMNRDGVTEWARTAQRWPGVFTRCGVLYLLKDEHRDNARSAIDDFSDDDYPMAFIEPARAREMLPALTPNAGDVILWEPLGGYVNPRLACQAFIAEARQHGAQVLEGTRVSAVNQTREGASVTAGSQTFTARLAVVAAGANSVTLAADCPVFSRTIPLSSLYSPTGEAPGVCLLDERSGGYLRPDGRDVAFVGGAPQHDAARPEQLQWSKANQRYHQKLTQHLLPGSDLHVVDGRDGYDGYTADLLPEIRLEKDKAIALFCGFSGRGAKYIPAAARRFSEQIKERLYA
ncbi:NAD(P)/FAD-dependent oxidoreductase [Cronobacter turicensis]|uniref:NAD(P)/FAD-dependent oxidoreductase n=1 Tax=Cronobacter turicensis TaxID=413502 RepID=UPI0035714C2F